MSTVSDNYFDLPSRIEDAFAEIDSDIVMDLLNTDEDYAALSDRMDKLKTQYPVIDKMNEGSGEIRMTAEEHRAYVDYLNLAPPNGGHGAAAHLLPRSHRCRGVSKKNQSDLTQTARKPRAVFSFYCLFGCFICIYFQEVYADNSDGDLFFCT